MTFFLEHQTTWAQIHRDVKQLLRGKTYQMMGELEDGDTDEGSLPDTRLLD